MVRPEGTSQALDPLDRSKAQTVERVLFLTQCIHRADRKIRKLCDERDKWIEELRKLLGVPLADRRSVTLADRVCMLMMFRPDDTFTAKGLVKELGTSSPASLRQVLVKLTEKDVLKKVGHGQWKYDARRNQGEDREDQSEIGSLPSGGRVER